MKEESYGTCGFLFCFKRTQIHGVSELQTDDSKCLSRNKFLYTVKMI